MNDADRDMLPLLAGWLDGELTPEDKQRVESALAISAELRAVLAEWQSVDAAMPQGEPARPEAAWEALAMRVDATIAAEAESKATTPAAQTHSPAKRFKRDRSWTAWFGSHRWAMGGGGVLVAATLAMLFWAAPEELLQDAGVLGQDASRQFNREKIKVALEAAPPAAPPKLSAASNDVPRSAASPAREESTKKESRERKPALAEGVPKVPKHSGRPSPQSPPEIVEKESAAGKTQQIAPADETKQNMPAIDVTQRATAAEEADNLVPSVSETKPDNDEVEASPQSRSTTSFQLTAPAERASSTEVSNTATYLQMELDLDAAITADNRDALQNVLADLDQHLAEAPQDTTNVTALKVFVRARAEFLRLFPEAPENKDACTEIHSAYVDWQKLATATQKESWEGLRIQNLVREVCPD